MQGERDYPIGHPAASDYKGEIYKPRRAPWEADFEDEHPARGGANTDPLDTPDGMRAAVLERKQDLDELRAIGSLPEQEGKEPNAIISADPKQIDALEYLKASNYSDRQAREIIETYGADAVLLDKVNKGKR